MTPRSLALSLTAMALLGAGPASAACQFQKLVDVPVTMDGLRPTIMTKINGVDAKFLVDTGAFFGGVTPEAAAQYKMPHSAAPINIMVVGVGGQKRDLRAVEAENFSFAGIGFRNQQFVLLGRIGEGLAGNIGENLMGPFDVEYDLANGVIRYFKPMGCGYNDNLAYWSQGMALSRLSIIEPTSILTKVIVDAKVDGHTVKVKFDSGSSLSILSLNAASRAGVKVSSEGVVSGGIGYGVYGKGLESFVAPFASFQIGDEEIKNTRLRAGDVELGDSDMLLGADFFLSHRILISNSQKKVYFTYNGGPVFRLDSAPQQSAQAGPPPARPDGAVPTASAPAPAGEEPKTASEFARRAAAAAARHEFQPAIADYTRAIELEPDNAAHYRARAMVRLAARQPVLAMADLDEALKRQPNDPEALMRRGELYLAARDLVRAKVDFDTAQKLAPADSTWVQQAGFDYSRAGQFEAAIQELDVWIASHPKDENLPQVQSARCYARGAWGKELDVALADCDAAVKRYKTSDIMTNRALVLLRLGRLDEAIAEYGAALKAQPHLAAALYGRGLAELKKGQAAEGAADVSAAKALAPGLPEQYRRFGLSPDAPTPAGAP